MAKERGPFALTRAQSQSLARALRLCTAWEELPPGDMAASLLHQDAGIEVEVTIYRARPVAPKAPIGFRRE